MVRGAGRKDFNVPVIVVEELCRYLTRINAASDAASTLRRGEVDCEAFSCRLRLVIVVVGGSDMSTSNAEFVPTKILFVGAGAIGASVAAWVAANNDGVYVYDIGEVLAVIKSNGITTYQTDAPDTTCKTVHVQTIDRPGDLPDVDVVVLAVKNYSLSAVARQVREQLGDRPVIVSMANGTDNQTILPKLFSKVIYCVVCYNAKRDSPGIVSYTRKGPLLLGTPDNTLPSELRRVQALLASGCLTETVSDLQDAVHTKIVINLTNALDALVGRGSVPLSNSDVYQRLLANTLWEGAKIIRAAGYREHRIAGMPSFNMLHLVTFLPLWMFRSAFERANKAIIMTSMTQDVVLHGARDTELESLTGYMIRLAEKVGVAAPYNHTIYRLGRERFHSGYQAMRCEEVQAEVDRAIEANKH
ncbi:putative 2-dehydropantoate 2-reductase [Burkholderiales bacterium]|nr:putative 2-dehydropantoate 2-reductase [Burkholderiales bacterium]